MPTISQGQIAKIFFNGYKGNLFAADQLAQDMKRLIDEAVAEAARLCAGQRPGFDFRRHPVMRQKLDEIIGRLRQQMESAIEQGSKDAWLRAETTTSKVVEAMAVGNPKLADILTAGLNVRQNDRALEAFQGRVINGMRLSDRVWNLTAQTQAQIEQGIEVALAEATPAAQLSRQVRNCLQNPENFFRRFKYKVKDEPLFDDKGNPILDSTGKQATHPVYGRKWKRRYIDADGNTRWQDVNLDDYRYGRGVYRSAYKNAMRLARTEINMAYQTSDHERWKRSWWVKGIRVGLSNNHPMPDICNDLAGDYPADFKFIGWHPQCRCFAHAITATDEEIQDYYRRKRSGEDMSEYEVPGKIKEMPAGAKQWLSANRERLEEAKAKGTVPFFVTDNAKYTGAQFAKTNNPETNSKAQIREIHSNNSIPPTNPPTNPEFTADDDFIRTSRGKFEAYPKYNGKEYNIRHFDEQTGGYYVTLQGHQFSNVKPKSPITPNPYLTGGKAEIRIVEFLHKQGKQIELLPENGNKKGMPDMAFDGRTWDSKYVPIANQETIRTYIRDAGKADCAIFSFGEKNRTHDILIAVEREIGRLKSMGRDAGGLPDIYIFTESDGLRLIKKIKGAQ